MTESSLDSTGTYRAFLSYSHVDKAWADWLHKTLETYRVPRRLVGTKSTIGTIPRRLTPIFRDSAELASADDLGREVTAALAQSEALIVICSPHSARSRWVNEEVLTFKRMGRGERLFCLIVDGEPNASDSPGREAEECFCPVLRHIFDEHGQATRQRTEPIAADARPGKDGKTGAKLKLIAGLLDVGYDTLVQREAHRRHRRMLTVTVAAVAGMTIASGLALFAYNARNEARQRQAQTEDALNFMLGDLHDKLEATGRLDLMAAVTDKAMALFADGKPGSLTDMELTQQSRALVQIGEIRLNEARLGPAMDAFQRAYQRSAELTTRHPGNGRFLFDRAQAEYWIGDVYRRQGDLNKANIWLIRYRDSTLALLKIDPHNHDWQLETTYGEHNLAVLALDRGDLDSARQGFRAELATQQQLSREQPDDPQLITDVADTISWLGNVAEQRGDLAEARRLFGEQVRQLDGVRRRYPGDFRWLSAWAGAQTLLGVSLGALGRNEEGSRTLADAADAYRTLTEHDPNNVPWRDGLAKVQVTRAAFALAAGRTNEAEKLLAAVMAHVQEPGDSETPQDHRPIHRVLSRGWLLRARIAWRSGDPGKAMDAVNRSLADARAETAKDGVGDASLADRAEALLLMGMLQQAQSPLVPPPAWTEARGLLAPRAPDSHYWRILDPWLRASLLTGDAAHARIARDRLDASGYVPLQPWPASANPSVSLPTTAGDHHAK